VDNERYDDYNRWTGGINFGGKARPLTSSSSASHSRQMFAVACSSVLTWQMKRSERR